jgi:hypothetical protein
MDTYNCNICFEIFKNKRALDRHNNKKTKCNVVTDYKCESCNKYFIHNKNLQEHTAKKICVKYVESYNNSIIQNKIIENDQMIDSKEKKQAIKSLINSSINENLKIELLKKHNITLLDDQIKAILSSDMSCDDKTLNLISYINKEPVINNKNNGVITTNNTQVTNNIQINNFRNENIEYLNNEYFKDLLMNNHIETAYMKLTEDIYLNEDHPENLTIKVDNLNNKFAFIYEDGKWKGILKYELKNILHDTNSRLLKVHYRKLKDLLDTAKKNSINVFLARQYDSDPHLKDMNEKMVLLFYEGRSKV